MLRSYLRRFFAWLIFRPKSKNWYKRKGYQGNNDTQLFQDFLSKQSQEGAIFYSEFQHITLKRQYISSGNDRLDSVLVVPDDELVKDKPGYGLIFIMIQGRGEYYECRFRDMARLAKNTGASVLCFNPKGVNSSSGKTGKLTDIASDAIAVIKYLLTEKVKPEQIIILGNSLGAAISEMACRYFHKTKNINFRQINSNSFKNLGSVIAYKYRLPIMTKILSKIMHFADWEIEVGSDFYKTSPYCCYLRRKNDRTILAGAEYHIMVNQQQDYANSPDIYKEANKWLNENSQLIYQGSSSRDPHDLSLHHFRVKALDKKSKNKSVYDFINYYLEFSNKVVLSDSEDKQYNRVLKL